MWFFGLRMSKLSQKLLNVQGRVWRGESLTQALDIEGVLALRDENGVLTLIVDDGSVKVADGAIFLGGKIETETTPQPLAVDPPKRPRGRPRKTPKPVEEVAEKPVEKEEVAENKPQEEADMGVPTVTHEGWKATVVPVGKRHLGEFLGDQNRAVMAWLKYVWSANPDRVVPPNTTEEVINAFEAAMLEGCEELGITQKDLPVAKK